MLKPGDVARIDLFHKDDDPTLAPFEYTLFESPSAPYLTSPSTIDDGSVCLIIATQEGGWAFCMFPNAFGWVEVEFLSNVYT